MSGIPTGLVIRADDGHADVSTWRVGACAGCSEAPSCGITEAECREEVLTVRNAVGARVGDTVELDLPGHAALRLSMLVWVVPAVGLLLGAVSGTALAGAWRLDPDVGTLVGALVGAGLAYVLLRRIDRSAAQDPGFTPFIVRVCERGSLR